MTMKARDMLGIRFGGKVVQSSTIVLKEDVIPKCRQDSGLLLLVPKSQLFQTLLVIYLTHLSAHGVCIPR